MITLSGRVIDSICVMEVQEHLEFIRVYGSLLSSIMHECSLKI